MLALARMPGSKSRVAPRLVELFPKHHCYVEPFGCTGAVLFAKPPSPVEIYNDADGRWVTLLRVIKYSPQEFLVATRWEVSSRAEFERYRAELRTGDDSISGKPLSDIDIAVRVWYLSKNSFSGNLQSFSVSSKRKPSMNPHALTPLVEKLHDRLHKVTIECKDFEPIIKKFDDPDTFVFADPPYNCNGQKHYGKRFKWADFERLYEVLKSMKGKFLMTINNDPAIRDLFKGFNVMDFDLQYSVMKGERRAARELIYTNYDQERRPQLFEEAK